ncbi:MAG: hypothetical protein M3457_14315, partial [Chloroflexota bacterium]|nr:hypothetical protein [Chloroflexota bacterium]
HGIVLCGVDPRSVDSNSAVGDVIRWYKSSVVEAYRLGVLHQNWEPYDRHLWQRGYHDRIVRTAVEQMTIRAYVY